MHPIKIYPSCCILAYDVKESNPKVKAPMRHILLLSVGSWRNVPIQCELQTITKVWCSILGPGSMKIQVFGKTGLCLIDISPIG